MNRRPAAHNTAYTLWANAPTCPSGHCSLSRNLVYAENVIDKTRGR